mmetsp:Transcript_2438/g.6234  ORF Transcript_2438/g.6234 Transcript_2438/m.6234 type:complete len:209 (-) Transcript_2438:230-856(-)|eukprot:CAMPEP_0202856972 /NCGR_PEP_ID=MMETSP1391-20130828/79_1 /ASSEMBLY_ACC=CAM_ASM_000867 /TAXON_ID=1034604 /ORGANISM="Chlamydomonas leiostraca, Strain SAG 11-49" /LENGTH=208 /DNA_ID=CAMNT_0049535707 /DNA_START=55 /DNA_END=681 /DNA_ORIENTATION=-
MALRQGSRALVQALSRSTNALTSQSETLIAGAALQQQQLRFIGGDKIPEYWGKPSPYTGGTAFLGTPTNHQDLIKKRPLSPDVIGLDGKSRHYNFPWAAISSITNRVTGVVLAGGVYGASAIALTGNIGNTVNMIANWPGIITFPVKFAIAYTVFYHYMGAVRHFVWDHHKIGNQADKTSLLELGPAEVSSKAIFALAGVLAFAAACA